MKKHHQTKVFAVSAIALLATVIGAQAASINWGTATNISGTATDVSTDGTLVYAINFGGTQGQTSISPTINGVTFVGANTSGASNIFSTTANTWSRDTYRGTAAPFTSIPTDYQTLLQSAIGTPDSSGTKGAFTITLDGLTIGSQYQIQLWSNESRFRNTEYYSYSSLDVSAGNSVILSSNTQEANGGLGQYVIGTFTADGTTQTLTFTSTSAPKDGMALINAMQLRQIPEASTYALIFAICAGAIVGLRRRSR